MKYSRLGLILGCLLCFGCTVSGKDNGKIEFAFATTLSIGTVTATTGAEPSATLTLDDRIVDKFTKDSEEFED